MADCDPLDAIEDRLAKFQRVCDGDAAWMAGQIRRLRARVAQLEDRDPFDVFTKDGA